MKKVLIIKLGYSETLASFLNSNISLGDVLRTTFILHYFKDCEVTWLVDEKGRPLIEDNPYLKKILVYNSGCLNELKKEEFDVVINFEKLPEICLLSDAINAREHFGFKLDDLDNGCKNVLGNSLKLVEISRNKEKKRRNRYCWQQILAGSIGEKWNGERYILGYKPVSSIKYDIGFNWTTSSVWKDKAWPKIYWKKLADLIEENYSLSWQQGLDNLYDYMEWINSCRLIVTADTLGLHLALALNKRIIALFGPTSPHEIFFYGQGSYLIPQAPYKCIPCFQFECGKERMCMEYIYPEQVKERIDAEFKKINTSREI